MNKKYENRKMTALDAQRAAHWIAFAPVVFQVSRLMLKYGIFSMLEEAGRKEPAGMTAQQIASAAGISVYGAKVLLESSLTAGTVFCREGRFTLSKIGWFLLNDDMVRADIDFNHDVNYKGLFHLDEAVRTGKPAGLGEFGNWPTLYEGLSSFPPEIRGSWMNFDHFYSDSSFGEALRHVLEDRPATILDIGGNTGKFALKCVETDADINVTVMDLPQQIALLKKNVEGKAGAERIHVHPGNLLDLETSVPGGFDAVWMSQFLDCFSEEQTSGILKRVAAALKPGAAVFIMETLWDRQRFDTASFDLAQTSVYFTAMANGNSKMFSYDDLSSLIVESGLRIVETADGLGYGHTLIKCVK